MTFSTDAAVIKVTKTGESDRIVTFLTREKGVLKAFAKSADRPKNKLHSGTNLFCCGNYTFYDNGKTLNISECEVKEIFYNLRKDIKVLSLAQYFCALSSELSPVEDNAENCYRLLLNSLYFLTDGKHDINVMKSVFELRLISEAGYMPYLVACKDCGVFETSSMSFDFGSGILKCENCCDRNIRLYPLEVISAMRHIVYSDLPKLFTLNVSKNNVPALNYLTENYLLSKVQHTFATLDFYNSL